MFERLEMIKKILLWCAVIFVSIQIYGFSSKTATESSGESGRIAHNIVEIINKFIEMEDNQKDDVFFVVHHTIRKCAHLTEYFILTVLVFFLARNYGLKRSVCAIISLGYCIVFATTDEIHQLFIEGRSGEIRDVLIDFSGGVLANVCIFFGIKIKNKLFDKK